MFSHSACNRALGGFLLAALVPVNDASAQSPSLTNAEMRQFLLTADIVGSRPVGSGTTEPWRLTLSDGTLTQDALFQSIDMKRDRYQTDDGRTELFFVDSYRYNCAAYELAELLGLDDMVPVTVERTWRGERGSLSWWIENVKWDGSNIFKDKLQPPNSRLWQYQLQKNFIFEALIYDTDRNMGNMLITEDWKLWMVDFTRAFRRWRKLPKPETLALCERSLLHRLKELKEDGLKQKVGAFLMEVEIDALLARRDLIVEHFEKLVAQKGEAHVLYGAPPAPP